MMDLTKMPLHAVPREAEADDGPGAYGAALGERLRTVRQQQGLSLHNVEDRSGGDLKASVVGAYERGERAVSVARLRVIAEFYRVPISELLPPTPNDAPSAGDARNGLRLDLTRLGAAEVADREVFERFAGTIQARRGDYNGRVLTLRAADLQALAAVVGASVDELEQRLETAGVAHAIA